MKSEDIIPNHGVHQVEEDSNPYAPPSADVGSASGEMLEAQFPAASTGKRFCNYLIDRTIAVGGLPALIGLALGFAEQAGLASGWLTWLEESSWLTQYSFGALISFIYFAGMESLTGLTIGKLVTGCKVISNDGTRPKPAQVVGRTLARFVPFEPFSFLGGLPSGWHDRWSNTCVVDVRAGRKALAMIRRS